MKTQNYKRLLLLDTQINCWILNYFFSTYGASSSCTCTRKYLLYIYTFTRGLSVNKSRDHINPTPNLLIVVFTSKTIQPLILIINSPTNVYSDFLYANGASKSHVRYLPPDDAAWIQHVTLSTDAAGTRMNAFIVPQA